MSFVTAVLTEVEHIALPLPLIAYPMVAAVLFLALGIVLWSFRDVSNRHSGKADAYAAAHGGHGSSTGGH
ncbi:MULTISPECIES: hypothetical protein [Cryobacterium]|jgi:hypothetical protein|uniref:Uncharacterized protein n=1 Tax=Cryobacterium levicorallinum TaxID=995038 RepID=A0A1I3BYP0_9MICO|nr:MULTISPECIES: hypothetical protein [Cryobacterium]TFB85648.1 hypothetical protein E3O11_06665 [Cryobacterium levicorallinum]TFD21184.1 hypothetical protein E3T31_09990 [Cryobacterium sp. TMS1-13-1]TFD65905.1 hypothetical protein E3T41_00700 [Cryobacterium sp. Hh38]SFH67059.1 hypothetical protein SAMN05216274_11115 [Cryobacterium levicorallinum]GEP27228.1 hypothetical protein CLE01_18260 [Cryobacterium levicorallinum]